MSLQLNQLEQIKKLYPDYSFQELATKLDMEKTRVFRLFNGYEMKLSEFEKIKLHLDQTLEGDSDFLAISHKCLNDLALNEVESLKEQMERSLRWAEIKKANSKVRKIGKIGKIA